MISVCYKGISTILNQVKHNNVIKVSYLKMINNISTINSYRMYECVNPVTACVFLLLFLYEISCVIGVMFVPKHNIGTSRFCILITYNVLMKKHY